MKEVKLVLSRKEFLILSDCLKIVSNIAENEIFSFSSGFKEDDLKTLDDKIWSFVK